MQFSHPVRIFICLLRMKTFSPCFISLVQMYLNPFFYFSIILGWSRLGVFTEGVPPPCFRTAALINSRVFFGGISQRPRRVWSKPSVSFVFLSLLPARPRLGVRVAASDGLQCVLFIAFPPASLISPRQGKVEGTRGPRVLVLGAACPSVRSPVPVKCVLESRTSSPVSKRNN